MTTPEKVIDIESLATNWNPEERRLQRIVQRNFKVRSTRDGSVPMVGGDWVLSAEGKAATLAFAFRGPSGTNNGEERFGLTVAHLVERIGDPVYAFASDDANPRTGLYPVRKVGEVVSLDVINDSMVFKFLCNVQVNLYKINLGSSTNLHHLRIPDWSEIGGLSVGTVVVGFGAQRRGTKGVITVRCQHADHVLNRSDVGVESDTGTMLTDDGDCGMLYLDEYGTPWTMHHAVTRNNDGTYCSWGTRLDVIMASHYEFFGIKGSQAPAPHQLNSIPTKSPAPFGELPLKSFGIEFRPGEEPGNSKKATAIERQAPRMIFDRLEFPRE